MFPTMAGGNIPPMRFVKMDTTGNKVVLCGAGDLPIGVSQRGTRYPPYSTLDDGFAAVAGESFQVYGLNETAVLESFGTINPGVPIKSDASGRGLAAIAGDKYGAIASQVMATGKLYEVLVAFGELET